MDKICLLQSYTKRLFSLRGSKQPNTTWKSGKTEEWDRKKPEKNIKLKNGMKIVFVVHWIPLKKRSQAPFKFHNTITKIEWKMKKRQTHEKAEGAMPNQINLPTVNLNNVLKRKRPNLLCLFYLNYDRSQFGAFHYFKCPQPKC